MKVEAEYCKVKKTKTKVKKKWKKKKNERWKKKRELTHTAYRTDAQENIHKSRFIVCDSLCEAKITKPDADKKNRIHTHTHTLI